MNTCRNCIYWQNHYPNDGGICWMLKNRVEDVQGPVKSLTCGDTRTPLVIGDTLMIVLKAIPATPIITHFSSTCDKHACDDQDSEAEKLVADAEYRRDCQENR